MFLGTSWNGGVFPSPGTLSPEQNLFLIPRQPLARGETQRALQVESPGARKVPRKRAAHAVGGPQPSPQPRLCVQIHRPTPVSGASPVHCRTACSLRRKRCDCSFLSPAVGPAPPGRTASASGLWSLPVAPASPAPALGRFWSCRACASSLLRRPRLSRF